MHPSLERLEAGLDHVRNSPADDGRLELIVRRPAEDAREVLETGEFDPVEGLVGDNWRARGNRHTVDGSADPRAQVTLMNARVAELVAGERSRWPLAGDQLYVDLDLSGENLAPGTRLAIGTATIEISDKPHRGCAKFAARFGPEALRFVKAPESASLHLRGVNATVVSGGEVHVRDAIRKVSSIRAAIADDAGAIAGVHVDSWRAAYQGVMSAELLAGLSVEERAERWRTRLSAEGDPRVGVLVAEEGGRLVGFASFGPTGDDGAEPTTLELTTLYVAPDWWSQGIGRRLLRAATSEMRPRGFARATLWVLEANDRARRFYDAAGWNPDGSRTEHHPSSDGQPTIRYAVDL